jgi:GNAT superfamily N-acetyltransferase
MIQIEQIPDYLVWPIRHKVMYPDMDFESIKLPEDESGMHMALYDENKIISVVSLFIENNEMQLRKFATLQEYQGKGYGSALLRYVIDYAKHISIFRLWCNARKDALAFYCKFDFKETEITFFKNGIDFVVMELNLNA